MKPEISFVTCSRNDDFTGTPIVEKMKFSLNSLLNQVEKFKLPCEIVIVDWNYLETTPRLREVLELVLTHPFATIKVIEVPATYHRKFNDWESRPIQGAAAANVGIRRANGEYVVCRSSDVFYSDELVKFLAKSDLRTDRFYRCNRLDVDNKVFENISSMIGDWNNFLKKCSENTLVVNDANTTKPQEISKLPFLHTNACGDFTLTSKKNWERIQGYREGEHVYPLYSDAICLYALFGSGVCQEILQDDMVVYKLKHQGMSGSFVKEQMPPVAEEIESDIYRLKSASKATPIVYALRTRKGYPYIVYKSQNAHFFPGNATYERLYRWLATGKVPAKFNTPNWGLSDEDLATYTICHQR